MDTKDFLASIIKEPNIPQLFAKIAKLYPEETVYSQAIASAEESTTSPRPTRSENYAEVASKVWKLANFLIAQGFKPGDKAAIISYTRPEWLIADLAILAAGGVSVSIYQSVNREETGYILFDSGAKFIFAENQEQIEKLAWLAKNSCPIPETEDRAATETQLSFAKIITFETVHSELTSLELSDLLADTKIPATVPPVLSSIEPQALASLVYTSGTTGPPKGVMQTHGNHIANLWQAADTSLFAPNGDIFLFLPLAHSFARLIGYIGFLTPTKARFPAIVDPKSSALQPNSVTRDLREMSAKVVPSVPRILEKMAAGVREKSHGFGLGPLVVRTTLSAARRMSEHCKNNSAPGVLDQLLYAGTAGVRTKIKQRLFGPNFEHVVSGGAKLQIEVNEFFQSLGITILEGYGLTETCVATNVNRLEKNKIGSVGPVLRDIQIKIAEDDEILFKGPNITQAYYNRPKASAEAWDKDGWFHTGDLGRLDDDGYLYITGRKKELIVTSGGKKVAPQPIEEKLAASRFISTAVLYGDGRSYCVALVSLEDSAVVDYLDFNRLPFSRPLYTCKEVNALISREVARVNEGLSRFETIKNFRILPEDCTVENGLLTPTFKVKRKLVYAKYTALINEMYESGAT